jgi:hypothetical protein
MESVGAGGDESGSAGDTESGWIGGRESGWIGGRESGRMAGTAPGRAGGSRLEVDADRSHRAHPSGLPLAELHVDLLADEVVARERPARARFTFHQVERAGIADGQQPLDRLRAG